MKGLLAITVVALCLATACKAERGSTSDNETAGKLSYETFKTPSGKELKIGLIKHGSICISYDGYEMHIDPVASMAKPLDYAKMPKADLILVTHEHGDHLDAAAIETLSTANTVIYTNGRVGESLRKGEALANGDERTVGRGIIIKAVPAYNTTEDRLQFHPKGVGNGYLINAGGMRIYVAGDTEDIPEMAELSNIDIAFLPVNQPYTMTVSQAERAARTIQPKVLIPYHYGDTDIEQLKERLTETGIEVLIRDMR